MAKKFGKFLLFTAAVGSAAAAYYYFRKKDAENDLIEDEDYDDFSEDLCDDADTSKNYVTLTPDTDTAQEEKKDSFIPLNQVAQNTNADKNEAETEATTEVEEFFDEEDESSEKSPISNN